MNKEEAKARISELSKIIENHNYNYYILTQPTISDYDFDMLLNELIDLEKQFPDLVLPDSPTQRVGGDLTKEFKTVKHRYPMLSLSNSYNIEEVKDFISRIKKNYASIFIEKEQTSIHLSTRIKLVSCFLCNFKYQRQ